MPTGALTVRELRGVLAAHFPEDAWIIGQSLAFQGDSFSFIVEDSLELTRANIAALANDAADRAYWADESAIGVLQRYLGVRLLIFNAAAAEGNRCQCVGDVSTAGGGRPLFIILRHSHKSTKTQHYDLYALSSARLSGDVSSRAAVSVFDDMSLPAGVKRAFASICPDAMPEWKTAAASGDADAADEAAN